MSHAKSCRIGYRSNVWFRILFAVASSLVFDAASAAIPASQREALMTFYTQTNGDGWVVRTNWNGAPGTECDWYGMTCDAAKTTVVAIELRGDQLTGTLPSLAGLPDLEAFDIGVSTESATAIPKVILGNAVGGPIPSFAGMAHLKTFTARGNQLSGAVHELSAAPNMSYVDLSNNHLNALPVSCAGATALDHFDAESNFMTGPIPPLDGLVNLQYFRVSDNYLSGSLPTLTGLSHLQKFDASYNELTGNIPPLGGLGRLAMFSVDYNLLEGNFPQLSGLPLTGFTASHNFLSGEIPDLSGLTALTTFNVGENALSGTLPPMPDAALLQTFVITGNYITGTVPPFAQTTLQYFGLGFNALSGVLPQAPMFVEGGYVQLCPNLLTPATDPPSPIDLEWNVASGQTPWSQDCATTPSKTLVSLYSRNRLTAYGTQMQLVAYVYGNHPTGTVDFNIHLALVGTTTLCAKVPLVNGVATCKALPPAVSSAVNLLAQYSGDAANAGATGSLTGSEYIVNAVTSSVNPAQVGQALTLETRFDGNATNVNFLDGETTLCANVGVSSSNGVQRADCVATFATSGAHTITASFELNGSTITTQPLVQNIVDVVPFDANQFALTGTWYDPIAAGQGMMLEVFSDKALDGVGVLFAGSFSLDVNGQQQWVSLQGSMASAHAATYNLGIFESANGTFNVAPPVGVALVGTATLTFTDCTHATLTSQLDNGPVTVTPYVRLSASENCTTVWPANLAVPRPAPPPNYDDALHSGAWYNPAATGQGLMVDIVPAETTFFAAWYTYAPQSAGATGVQSQRWFSLQTNDYTPGNLTLTGVPIYASSDAPPLSGVVTTQVGTADITFNSCTAMTIAYTFTQGEFSGLSGSIDERADPAGAGCE